MSRPSQIEHLVDDPPGAELAQTDGSAARSRDKIVLRKLGAFGGLALTAIAIVLVLAFGIPWLIGLVW